MALEDMGSFLELQGYVVEYRKCPVCNVKYLAVFPKGYDTNKCKSLGE